MHWEVYRPMKAGWNSGRQRENSPGNRILPVKTMPCRSSTVMSCTVKGAEGKDEAYLKLYDGHDWKWFRVYV